jgi:hypothetical protein
MGCEADILRQGQPVTVVGFGEDEDRVVGVKREVTTEFNYLTGNNEANIGGGGKDSCYGDSGGPAFVQLPDGTWRVFGVVAHGGECGRGGFYSVMPFFVDWLESASDVDVTPCHDNDGKWAPTAACQGFPMEPQVATGAWPDACGNGLLSGPASTCGAPYDVTPPVVAFHAPRPNTEFVLSGAITSVAVAVVIEAYDEGVVGVDEVEVQIDGLALQQQPEVDGDLYTFEGVELGVGSHTITAVAIDRNGNQADPRQVAVVVVESATNDDGSQTGPATDDDGPQAGPATNDDGPQTGLRPSVGEPNRERMRYATTSVPSCSSGASAPLWLVFLLTLGVWPRKNRHTQSEEQCARDNQRARPCVCITHTHTLRPLTRSDDRGHE